MFKEYGSGREADAEYFAQLRRLFNDAGVHWQTHSYRAGYGGGTIAQWFANADIDAHRRRHRHPEHALADGRVGEGRSVGALSGVQGISRRPRAGGCRTQLTLGPSFAGPLVSM